MSLEDLHRADLFARSAAFRSHRRQCPPSGTQQWRDRVANHEGLYGYATARPRPLPPPRHGARRP